MNCLPRQTTWSPFRSAREYCHWCCADQSSEVEACAAVRCPLHPFRLSPETREGFQGILKAIRRKCVDCAGGSPFEMKKCVQRDCPLWDFRTGNNPHSLSGGSR